MKVDLSNWNKATCKSAERDSHGFLVGPEALVQKKWVELPMCPKKMAKDDPNIPLKSNLENVSVATCKKEKR